MTESVIYWLIMAGEQGSSDCNGCGYGSSGRDRDKVISIKKLDLLDQCGPGP